ncbi:MAG: type II and III secretion system protein [Bryobacteraceae bacterium]|nr:type II and III secretion system protein [Bryobacteraceae bacterium]
MRFVCLALALACGAVVCTAAGDAPTGTAAAKSLFDRARKAAKNGDFVRSYTLAAQARALDPANPAYSAYEEVVQRKALQELKALPAGAAGGDEGDEFLGVLTESEVEEARRPLPPRKLAARSEVRSFALRDNPRPLWEQVSRAYGLEVVFDGDYPPSSAPVRFTIEEAGYKEALWALEAATNSFVVPISDRLMLVVKDTPQKRTEVEPTAAAVIPVPSPVTVQEAQEVARTVQQVIEIQRLIIDSARRLVLIRDRVSKVYAARDLLQQMLVYSGQVSIEVEFIAVSRNSNLDYGLRLQTLFPLVNFGNKGYSVPEGFTRFAVFGGGKTFMGLGIADASLFANYTRSDASSLLRNEIRSLEGKPASIHVGDKYPILTNGYYGGEVGEGAYRPPPTVNFEDLGVVLKLTPFIHGDEDVTIELEAEYKVLTGQTLNDIPVIANRRFASRVRLKQGEWGVLAGLMTESSQRSYSGLAGIVSIPVLGPFLRENSRSRQFSEILVLLKPKLVSLPPSEAVTRTFWIGSEGRFRTWL